MNKDLRLVRAKLVSDLRNVDDDLEEAFSETKTQVSPHILEVQRKKIAIQNLISAIDQFAEIMAKDLLNQPLRQDSTFNQSRMYDAADLISLRFAKNR